MTAAAASRSIEDWLDALIVATQAERRAVSIAALDGGYALQPVVCTRCDLRTTFVGAYRHLAETEAAWLREHLEDGPNASLHRPGDLVAAPRATQPDQPFWSTAPCRSCGAAVVWARTQRGKRMPVDAAASVAGTVLLVQQGSPMDPPLAVVVHTDAERAEVPDGALRTSHFATCPEADRWRRRSGR